MCEILLLYNALSSLQWPIHTGKLLCWRRNKRWLRSSPVLSLSLSLSLSLLLFCCGSGNLPSLCRRAHGWTGQMSLLGMVWVSAPSFLEDPQWDGIDIIIYTTRHRRFYLLAAEVERQAEDVVLTVQDTFRVLVSTGLAHFGGCRCWPTQ